MDEREHEVWVLASDILRQKKGQFSENILLLPFSPLTLLLGSGYLKHSPCVLKDNPQLLCGNSRERLDLCNWSLCTEGFPAAS